MRHGRLALIVFGVVLAGAAPAIGAPTRTTVVLNAPGSPRATALSSSFVQVDWTDTNTKETGYAVERAMSSSGPFTQVATTPRNIMSIGDGSVAANATYFYRVRATGRRNVFSAYSAAVSATTPKSGDRWPPSVPKDLVARVFACDQVSLRWTASFDGSGVKGYNIRRGTTTQFVAGQNFFTDATPGGTALSYTVSAIDTFDNESAPSAVVTATTTPCPGPGSWAKHFGGADDEVVTGSAVDASGDVYVVGRFTGNTNLGGVTLQSAGSHDIFVVKYANDGTHEWSK